MTNEATNAATTDEVLALRAEVARLKAELAETEDIKRRYLHTVAVLNSTEGFTEEEFADLLANRVNFEDTVREIQEMMRGQP